MPPIGTFRHGLKSQHTVPDSIEWLTDMLGSRLADQMDEIVKVFVPDGRRVGEQKLTTDQQLIQYRMLLEDPQGWLKWVSTAYAEMESKLADVPFDVRESKHLGEDVVRSVAIAWAVAYRSKMEALLNRKLSTTTEPVMAPVVGPPMMEANASDHIPSLS